jgi:hypothetical protein
MNVSDFASLGRRFWHGRRARRSYRLGQDLADYYRRRDPERGARLATQCYRRALRQLGRSPELVEQRSPAEVVRDRLAETTVRAAVRRHGRPIAIWGGGALLLAGLLVAFVPPVRRLVFPVDLADGRPWVATSAWQGFTATGVVKEATQTEGFFHTGEDASPSVTVDLGALKDVQRVEIENRRDALTYRLRALPLVIEVSADQKTWKRVGYRRADFKAWTTEFPSTRARYVRARVDRASYLHLRRIRVY